MFSVPITAATTFPLFFYCGVPGHCRNAMVGVINPSTGSPLATYQSQSRAATAVNVPAAVAGGQVVPNVVAPPASSSSAAASATTSVSSSGTAAGGAPQPTYSYSYSMYTEQPTPTVSSGGAGATGGAGGNGTRPNAAVALGEGAVGRAVLVGGAAAFGFAWLMG